MTYSADHGSRAAIYADLTTAGTMAVGTSTLTRIEAKAKWSTDNSRDYVDTTSFGDTSKTNVAGLPNASCTVEGHWDFAGSGSLLKNFIGSTLERGFMLFPDISNYNGWYFSGKAFASQTASGAVDSAVDQTLEVVAGPTGLTWTNP